MRQRKIRNLEEKLGMLSPWVVADPKERRGRWKEAGDRPLYLEIGCGKGKFITDLAARHTEWDFLAFEGNESVCFHALEKAAEKNLQNVRFVLSYVKNMDDFFADNELDGLFMNFSDPWPKAKHAKRRLTVGRRLGEYARAVKSGGLIEFKSDNDDLFDFSMEQFAGRDDLSVIFVTRDLHGDIPESEIITTEYEEKFMNSGKNINFLRAVVL